MCEYDGLKKGLINIFNSLSRLPTIPYTIMKFLALSPDAENLWKMLKYSDYDALSQPNLTFSEKMSLVWLTGAQEKFNVFLTPLIEDAVTEGKTILKSYQYYIHANELYTSTVVYAFDFLYSGVSSLVEYENAPVSRGDLAINILLNVLNGADVGGVGKMVFYDDMSRYCSAKATMGNSKTFTGVCLYMGVNIGDTGKVDECGN